jgi:hypothetical protein
MRSSAGGHVPTRDGRPVQLTDQKFVPGESHDFPGLGEALLAQW